MLERIEEAFLCSNFVDAIQLIKLYFKENLRRRSTPDRLQTAVEVDGICPLLNDYTNKQVLSVYLQCLFETKDESELIETRVLLTRFSPISYDIAILWSKVLIHYSETTEAAILLDDIKEQLVQLLAVQTTETKSSWYYEVLDLRIFDIILPLESPDAAIDQIKQDTVLTEQLKSQYIRSIEAFAYPKHELKKADSSSIPVAPPKIEEADTTNNPPAMSDISLPMIFTVAGIVAICGIYYKKELRQASTRVGRQVFGAVGQVHAYAFGD